MEYSYRTNTCANWHYYMKNAGTKFVLLILAAMLLLALAYFVLNFAGQQTGNQPNKQAGTNEQILDETSALIHIDYVVQNIGSLSPVSPVLGGSWYALRFWFADENNFYAEYEDGHILRQILLNYDGENYRVVGYFEPGEDMYELKSGQDTIFGRDLVRYEKNQETQAWERQN